MSRFNMKTRTIILIAAVTAFLTTILAVPLKISGSASDVSRETTQAPLDHKLETWLSALEWCESQGVGTAVNEVDLDGTPSYFWYQFKPGTFVAFGKQYGLLASSTTAASVLEKEMKDYELTREIVRRMARDPQVNLRKQFPDCINRKIGLPPRPSKTL